jgi:hypothetical protein
MTRFLTTLPIALALAAGACTGGGTVAASYSSPGYASQPGLVEVRPGVYVVENYDEPVFYADNFYWRFYGNTWYRSNYYNTGWVVARPPYSVAYIDRPQRYVRYRPGRHERVVIRDNRGRLHVRRHR